MRVRRWDLPGVMPERAGTKGPLRRGIGRVLRWGLVASIALMLLVVGASCWGTSSVRIERAPAPTITNDVTGLNPVRLSAVVQPTSAEAVAQAVREYPGPIAIGGGRYSMGGQTAVPGGLQIDMRKMNRILAIDTVARLITVQAGARWRQIQEAIDPLGLSVKIMQTYSNFTVGGSLSVNAHGRYVGQGPVALSVRSFRIVLANGSLVEASREVNPEIFFGAIGGYGGLGVITDATLELADNVRVRRTNTVMPVASYRAWFDSSVRHQPAALFHNADIYPDKYEVVNAVTYSATSDSLTVAHRLIPADRSYRTNRFAFQVIAGWPGGKWLREHLLDPWIFRGEPVTWRNYEASYDVAELEPASREQKTYVLQEYFVPVGRFDEFVPKLRYVLRKHDVNVINVSIRHAQPDPGTLLAWAPDERFAFVIYYQQETNKPAAVRVRRWTRELVDSVLSVGGSWYLPYQPHATPEQLTRGYPGHARFFALKARLDPANRFRNKLWDTYYLPTVDSAATPLSAPAIALLDTLHGYRRDEGQTFLTHPEWYIVYSSDEYAAWLEKRLPTDFPYLNSIGQYWTSHAEARRLTEHRYPFNWGYHVMLGVIGVSYSAELALKAAYENTVGRFSGWTAGGELTDEDRLAAEVAGDYSRFIHVRPWYEYRFAPRLAAVWTSMPAWGPHAFRKYERKVFLSVEYGVKAFYAWLIERATRAAYEPQDARMSMVVSGLQQAGRGRGLDARHMLLTMPRYDGFRDSVLALAATDSLVHIHEIAGNDQIFLTGVAPVGWDWSGAHGWGVTALELPSDSTRKRFTASLPVSQLLPVLRALRETPSLVVDHIYDY